jgi:hypothetical protein
MGNGCPEAPECKDKVVDITGAFCPDPSDSHGCPTTCDDDEYLCDTFEDENGCKNEAECVEKTIGNDEEDCPKHSVCPENCKVNELTCPGDMDENGCKNPDTCLTKTRDINGEFCPINCPGECLENEIHCEGLTTDEGCKGPDICEPVGVKTKPPEEEGTPCPGFCPIHECPEGEIKCPSVIEHCFGCRTFVNRTKSWTRCAFFFRRLSFYSDWLTYIWAFTTLIGGQALAMYLIFKAFSRTVYRTELTIDIPCLG